MKRITLTDIYVDLHERLVIENRDGGRLEEDYNAFSVITCQANGSTNMQISSERRSKHVDIGIDECHSIKNLEGFMNSMMMRRRASARRRT